MADKTVKAKLGSGAPIDFEFLKSEIAEKGPLRISKKNSPVETFLFISPCESDDEPCQAAAILVERRCGLSCITWSLTFEKLCQFESLNHLAEQVFEFGLEDSDAERQILEQAIIRNNGCSYEEVDRPFCTCHNCLEEFEPDVIWKGVLLTKVAFNLQQRNEWQQQVHQCFAEDENDFVQFFDDVFDLGYQTARMYGEYQLKTEIEASAIIGMKAQKNQEKRAEAAGEVSRKKRDARILCLLEKMEFIAKRSPDVARIGSKALADLALSDVVQEASDLWKQGRGRRDEYLDEMKADIRYSKRYNAIFKR